MTSAVLRMWTLYESPTDFPGQWVLREYAVGPGFAIALEAIVGPSRAEVVARLPPGRTWLPRASSDPPSCVGTWL